MRTNWKSRCRPSSVLALAMVLGAPGLASAQQQLFPNMTIRRERPCCTNEDPRYKTIRQQYWGYYPTCWRKFPPGWGCPSPEAPDWQASKRSSPVQLDKDQLPADGGARQPAGPGRRSSPFESDTPNGDREPSTLPPRPNMDSSPFDPIPSPPAGGGNRPAGNGDRPGDLPDRPGLPGDAPRAESPASGGPPPLAPPSGESAFAPRNGRRSLVAGLLGRNRTR